MSEPIPAVDSTTLAALERAAEQRDAAFPSPHVDRVDTPVAEALRRIGLKSHPWRGGASQNDECEECGRHPTDPVHTRPEPLVMPRQTITKAEAEAAYPARPEPLRSFVDAAAVDARLAHLEAQQVVLLRWVRHCQNLLMAVASLLRIDAEELNEADKRVQAAEAKWAQDSSR